MTGTAAGQAQPWQVVQTDAGPVSLAPIGDLQARAVEWKDWAAKTKITADSMRSHAEGRLADAGAILVARSSEWTVPADLRSTIENAKALTSQVDADDQTKASLKERELATGFIGRIGVRHEEHALDRDRVEAAAQLRDLLRSIARLAPPTTLPDADALRKAAAELKTQADAMDTQIAAAEGWASACESESGRRREAINAMGFDSLYEAALLQTSGAPAVESPVVLKADERACLSVPATLARMVTRTHYVGGGSGFSFPIGHTGIRYRVGSFSGEPIHQQSLSKIDAGTLVVTNQRLAFVGRTKSLSVPLDKVIHVEVFNDGLSVAREAKENADFFLTPNPKHVVFLLNWSLSNQSRSR